MHTSGSQKSILLSSTQHYILRDSAQQLATIHKSLPACRRMFVALQHVVRIQAGRAQHVGCTTLVSKTQGQKAISKLCTEHGYQPHLDCKPGCQCTCTLQAVRNQSC